MTYTDCVCDLTATACVRCGLPLQRGARRNCIRGDNRHSIKIVNAIARSGPGAELKALLATAGIAASQQCKCNGRAALMDANGCDWCEANIEESVGWLRESAAERGLPFLDVAARLLVRRAIANARKAEARRAKEAEQAAAEGPAA